MGYAAGVFSLEGFREANATKLLLQGHLGDKIVLQKHWDS